jgi:transcriptional regulator with XRE-family HTH domain
MPIGVDAASTRHERFHRRWSQEDLAAASGISVRTIQRLESGEPVALATLSAVAAAFEESPSNRNAALSTDQEASHSPVRRVTPLSIVSQIEPVLRAYLAMGFAKVPTEHDGCVGVKAGETHLILATAQFLVSEFGGAAIRSLAGNTIPYVYVESIERARGTLPRSARTIGEVWTHYRTREALIRFRKHHFILAEKSGFQGQP